MHHKKLRRDLWVMSACLFAAWIITTFSGIGLWYAKGGGHGLSHETADVFQMFVFSIIPALTSGYLLFGLGALNLFLKAKKSEDDHTA